jgi:hypothetical protein
MNRISAIEEEDFQADVEPGGVYQDLNEKLKQTGRAVFETIRGWPESGDFGTAGSGMH